MGGGRKKATLRCERPRNNSTLEFEVSALLGLDTENRIRAVEVVNAENERLARVRFQRKIVRVGVRHNGVRSLYEQVSLGALQKEARRRVEPKVKMGAAVDAVPVPSQHLPNRKVHLRPLALVTGQLRKNSLSSVGHRVGFSLTSVVTARQRSQELAKIQQLLQ